MTAGSVVVMVNDHGNGASLTCCGCALTSRWLTVATAPGAPKTSTTCLGLNGTISLDRPLLAEVLLCDPNIPCRR